MRSTRTALFSALALLAGASLAPAAGAKPVGAGYYGVSAPFIYDGTSETKRERYLARIARLGAGPVRIALSWDEVEPRPPRGRTHFYKWSQADGRVVLLAKHGLRMYPTLAYSADWAKVFGSSKQGPPRPAYYPHYAAFAAEAAKRYGVDGSFWEEHPELPYLPVLQWEIWNEPNLKFFWGGLRRDPAGFAALLAESITAIRGVQPGAKVVMGGLSGAARPQRYLRKLFRAQPALRQQLTHVGFHPYGSTPRRGLERLAAFREALDRHGSPRIWIEITEDGMSTADDENRRRYLTRMAASAPNSGCHVSRYIVHTWVTGERNRDEPEHWYGIAERNGRLKGSGRAFKRVIRAARRPGKAPAGAVRRVC